MEILREYLITVITAIFGTLGFAILFKVKPQSFVHVCILGAACHSIYFLLNTVLTLDAFIASICATAAVALASEVLARILKTPALVFLLAGVIPIVPGSTLYNTMASIITRDGDKAFYYGMEALKIALGIAGGILVVSVVMNIYLGVYNKIKSKLNGIKQ